MVERLVNELNRFCIAQLGCFHCTGIENYVVIKTFFNGKAFYNSTGNIIEV